jgi:integrase
MRGHIEQRSTGSWRIQASGGFDDTGKRIRVSRTVRGSRRDAEKELTRLLRELDDGTAARSGADTFGSYLTGRWLPHVRSRVTASTWRRYEELVRLHLIPRCGRVRLDKLRPHHLQATLDGMLADGAAPASVVKVHRVASQALRHAVRWQLMAVSPAVGVSPPRAARGRLRIPDSSETKRILEAAEGPCRIALRIAATTGMRRGEVLALRWSDLDLDAAVLRIRQGKTPRARRTISLPLSTVSALKRHRIEQAERRLLCGEAWQDADLVVDRGDGAAVHPDVMTRAFEKAAQAAKLDGIRLHDLRHAFASTLLAAGVNVKVVSEALGHASTAFTMDVYAHVLPTMGEQVATAIEDALG